MLSDIRILVTNDDGIDSIGLRVLVEKLKVLNLLPKFFELRCPYINGGAIKKKLKYIRRI